MEEKEKEEIKTEEKKVKTKKIQPEEKVFSQHLDKYGELNNSKNILYYISIVLLNISVLVLMMLWINNKEGVVSFDVVKEAFNWKIFILMCAIFVLIKMIQSVSLFISFHIKSKYNNFGVLYKANAVSDFYGKMSILNRGKLSSMSGYLSSTKIKPQHVISIEYEKWYYNVLVFLSLSLVMVIVGAFKWQKNTHIVITLITFAIIVCGFMYLLYLYMARHDKEKNLSICSFVARALSKLKLTSDFEKTYYGMVDKSAVVTKANRVSWTARILNMLSSLSVYVLRGLILYLIFSSIGLSTSEYYFKSLWLLLTLDLFKTIIPLPDGVIVLDLIFMLMLSKTLYPEYIWWVLLMYKVFENFIYDLHFLIILIVDKISLSISKKKNSTK